MQEGADDILPRSPIRRQTSCSSSRASSEILSYVDAAPQLEDLREEAAAESALRPSITPDLIHLESLGSTEANAAPSLLVNDLSFQISTKFDKSCTQWNESSQSMIPTELSQPWYTEPFSEQSLTAKVWVHVNFKREAYALKVLAENWIPISSIMMRNWCYDGLAWFTQACFYMTKLTQKRNAR